VLAGPDVHLIKDMPMPNRKPSADEQRAERGDEIRNPRREGDIDEIGASGGEEDFDLDDEDVEDEEGIEDEEIEDEDVG
jgi:hypothetical protein